MHSSIFLHWCTVSTIHGATFCLQPEPSLSPYLLIYGGSQVVVAVAICKRGDGHKGLTLNLLTASFLSPFMVNALASVSSASQTDCNKSTIQQNEPKSQTKKWTTGNREQKSPFQLKGVTDWQHTWTPSLSLGRKVQNWIREWTDKRTNLDFRL